MAGDRPVEFTGILPDHSWAAEKFPHAKLTGKTFPPFQGNFPGWNSRYLGGQASATAAKVAAVARGAAITRPPVRHDFHSNPCKPSSPPMYEVDRKISQVKRQFWDTNSGLDKKPENSENAFAQNAFGSEYATGVGDSHVQQFQTTNKN